LAQAINTVDRRPAGGAIVSRPFPELHNRRLALLTTALLVELLLRCQLGVLNWKRVLPSRFFAVFHILSLALILAAIGANVVWPVALYSYMTFPAARISAA